MPDSFTTSNKHNQFSSKFEMESDFRRAAKFDQKRADSSRRFGASTHNKTAPSTSLPGYVKPEAFPIKSQSPVTNYDPLIDSYDFPQKNAGTCGSDSVRRQSDFRGHTAGESLKGCPSNMRDPHVPSIPGTANKKHDSSKTSNILFVEGIPSDCTRREVSHIFRAFNGFRDIKVVHKVPRTREGRYRVLCFVEFADDNCALTALEALQGYKFDKEKPDSHTLKLHYAHFPFRLPSDGDRQHHKVSRR